MDNPRPLGKFETGSKTALPVFKKFIKKAVKKSDSRPFKVADEITMLVIDTHLQVKELTFHPRTQY